MRKSTAVLTIVGAAVAVVAAIAVLVPGYWTVRGFPLDDSWIHMVYGRSLATSFALDYNPGIPATGATSLAWAVVVALPHLFSSDVPTIVFTVKVLGFCMHVGTAVATFFAFDGGPQRRTVALLAALLVLTYPPLATASVSGMELPAASLVAVLLLVACRHRSVTAFAALAVVAPLVRPELTMVPIILAVTTFDVGARRDTVRLLSAAVAGLALAWTGMISRNLAVSGRPLASTIYAKARVGASPYQLLDLLDAFPFLEAPLVMSFLAILVFVVGRQLKAGRPIPLGAASFLTGCAYFVVAGLSSWMGRTGGIHFYYWRYALPGVVLMMAGILPVLEAVPLERFKDRIRLWVRIAVPAALLGGAALQSPAGYTWLHNDTANIDSIQVEIGRYLGRAEQSEIAWVFDAGATRYFGRPFVVDLVGLNTPEMLNPDFHDYLASRPPNFIVQLANVMAFDSAYVEKVPVIEFHVDPTKYPTVTEWIHQRVIVCPSGVPGGMWLLRLDGEHRIDFQP